MARNEVGQVLGAWCVVHSEAFIRASWDDLVYILTNLGCEVFGVI